MMSVANEREVDRSSVATTAGTDLSFFGVENPQGAGFGDDPAAHVGGTGGSGESRVPMELDSAMDTVEVDSRVSVHGLLEGSVSPEGASGDMETIGTSVSESSEGEVVSTSMAGGGQILAVGRQEVRVFEGNRVSYETGVSDVIMVQDRVGRNWMQGFELGDMVWGKVKSHPWWPGHIFNEVFASTHVRRLKREGHFLVAFFGDSSYGWFEPAELVPFDPHFTEKAKQTTIRNFVKAVEEAVDETSRREAIGLTCYCRNPSNFRPTHVPGYFYVDVPGFEPGGIYSLKQINSSRDRFVPEKALSFALQAAIKPLTTDFPGVDRIKSIAVLLAYRRAKFEEFDETYAQAFGVEPVRPSPNTRVIGDQPERFAPRATPLSGQLVFAEPLRHKRSPKPSSTAKVAKIASSKKNKYVLKRRDEARGDDSGSIAGGSLPKPSLPDFHSPANPYFNYFDILSPKQPSAQPGSVLPDASSAPASGSAIYPADGNYVLQKRPPSSVIASQKQQQFLPVYDGGEVGKVEVADAGVDAVHRQPASENWNFKKEPSPTGGSMRKVDAEGESMMFDSGSMFGWGTGVSSDLKDDKLAHGMPPAEVDRRKILSANAAGVPKKAKKLKRPLEDGNSVRSDDIVKKKKKKKMASVAEIGAVEHQLRGPTSEDLHKRSVTTKLTGAVAEHRREDGVTRAAEPSASAIRTPRIDLSTLNLEFPELVSYLQALALDPFYGIEGNVPVIVLSVFLNFRSLVYQKSLVLPMASEADTQELRAGGQLAIRAQPELDTGSTASAKAQVEQRELPSTSKTPKSFLKSDDPTKAGRKRTPSERQEELSARRIKKLNKLKHLATEKRATAAAGEKPVEGQKEAITRAMASATALPAKSKAAELARKQELPNTKTAEASRKHQEPPPAPPARAPTPTILVMKFPLRSTLPSVMSLKAKFARFGPLDHSATRVYWKSYTCKVLFKFKADAQAALEYAKSNDMFGQIKVNYQIRDVESPAAELPSDIGKQLPEPRTSEGPQFRPGDGSGGSGISFGQSRPLLSQPPRPPTGQLKSILKKPSDEAGSNGNGSGREAPRVKFMLDGGDRKMEPPPAAVVAGNANGRSNGDGPSAYAPSLNPPVTTKSVNFIPPPPPLSRPSLSNPTGMFDDRRFPPPPPLAPSLSASFPPPPLPILPPPRGVDGPEARNLMQVRFNEPQTQQQMQYAAGEGKGKGVVVDISDRMLSLLVRCSDIVGNLKSTLGYVPLHPL